jgi:hypothetical protein
MELHRDAKRPIVPGRICQVLYGWETYHADGGNDIGDRIAWSCGSQCCRTWIATTVDIRLEVSVV